MIARSQERGVSCTHASPEGRERRRDCDAALATFGVAGREDASGEAALGRGRVEVSDQGLEVPHARRYRISARERVGVATGGEKGARSDVERPARPDLAVHDDRCAIRERDATDPGAWLPLSVARWAGDVDAHGGRRDLREPARLRGRRETGVRVLE